MPTTTTAVRVTVDHDIHLHINEKTAHTITRGALHASQLTGAALFTWLLYKEMVSQSPHLLPQNASLAYKLPLAACTIPAICTLAETGYRGLKDVVTKKPTVQETIKTVPEKIKAKIKKTVRDW
jgi:hypothetical protein